MQSCFCLVAKIHRVEGVVKLLQGDSASVVGSTWVRNKLKQPRSPAATC